MRYLLGTILMFSVLASGPISAQMHGHGHMHGANGAGHDMANMPGLQGENATAEESAELAIMFQRFQTMSREVETLSNGIRTVTRSTDPEVMDALVNHTVGMIDRVGQMNDPKIFIQSPTLDIFFARGDSILSEVDVTEDGVIVIQTSDDPDVVAALHTHAAEVTAMVEQGMHAVHQMLMQRSSN